MLDGSANHSAGMALGYANALAQSASAATAKRAGLELSLPVEPRARTLYNPALRSSSYNFV